MSQSNTTIGRGKTDEKVKIVYTNCAGIEPGSTFEFPNGPAKVIEFDLSDVIPEKEAMIVHANTGLPEGYIFTENGEIKEQPNTIMPTNMEK